MRFHYFIAVLLVLPLLLIGCGGKAPAGDDISAEASQVAPE